MFQVTITTYAALVKIVGEKKEIAADTKKLKSMVPMIDREFDRDHFIIYHPERYPQFEAIKSALADSMKQLSLPI